MPHALTHGPRRRLLAPAGAPLVAALGRHWHRPVLALLAAALTACQTPPAGGPAHPAAASTPGATLAPPPALRTEGLPPIPASTLPAFQRYADVAGHGFVAWHPTRPEMLVAHRAPGSSSTQLWRLAGPGAAPQALTRGAERVSRAEWEPAQGRFIVFERDTGGDEAAQVHRLDPDTLATQQLTPAGERHSIAGWLRRSGLLVYSSVPLDRTASGGSRAQVATRFSLVDPMAPDTAVPGRQRRVIAELPGPGWFGFRVSPDETQAAVTRYLSATHSEVWLVQLASGERRRLLPAPGDALTRATHQVDDWEDDGRHLRVLSDRASEFRELVRVDLASGQTRRLTGHIPWDVATADAHGQTLALASNDDGRQTLRLFDRASGREWPAAQMPSVPPGSVTALRFHPATGALALVVDSPQGPGRVHVLDLASGRHQPWTMPAMPAGLPDALAQLPAQQTVRWTSFDGRQISGVLSLPPARCGGRRPVLLSMHGGPESQSKQGWNGRLNYFLIERCYALLEPNVRGSSGYGKTFLDLDNGVKREDSVKDMAAAIDWLASHPRLDARRVVVMGGSYGGYMALAAATRLSDRIAGAYSSVGISHFVSFLQNTESYRRDLRRAEYGDERDPAMRAHLQAISPLTNADAVAKPLLITQGRNDPRVPWTESEQIVRRLQQRGVPVWYLLADNEGHGFAKRENADFTLATLSVFLQQVFGE